MKIRSAAKINLALDVTGRREDGYHDIESVFQTVSIYDDVSVDISDTITVKCEIADELGECPDIPCDERNIAYKAAKLFLDETGAEKGCSIHIRKCIPSQAGLGGGSSDAAAVLFMLNELTVRMDGEKLAEMGARIGADVPFLLTGGTAYVSGIGEKVRRIGDFSGRTLLIARGKQGVSTAEAYAAIDSLKAPKHPQVAELMRCLSFGGKDVHKYFGNLFESAVMLTEADYIKLTMMFCGALKPTMTGSGSAVFGLFEDAAAAERCGEIIRSKGFYAKVCETVSESFVRITR